MRIQFPAAGGRTRRRVASYGCAKFPFLQTGPQEEAAPAERRSQWCVLVPHPDHQRISRIASSSRGDVPGGDVPESAIFSPWKRATKNTSVFRTRCPSCSNSEWASSTGPDSVTSIPSSSRSSRRAACTSVSFSSTAPPGVAQNTNSSPARNTANRISRTPPSASNRRIRSGGPCVSGVGSMRVGRVAGKGQGTWTPDCRLPAESVRKASRKRSSRKIPHGLPILHSQAVGRERPLPARGAPLAQAKRCAHDSALFLTQERLKMRYLALAGTGLVATVAINMKVTTILHTQVRESVAEH